MTPQEAAVRCLLGYHVEQFPADPKVILNALGYPTHGYASMAAHSMMPVSQIVETIATADAAIVEGVGLQGKPIRQVVYNDLWSEQPHVRHVLAHELGHICLGHETKPQTEPPIPEEEAAAEAFARCFMCPPSVFAALPGNLDQHLLCKAFCLNEKQLKKRRNSLQEDLDAVPPEMNDKLLKRVRPWLRSRACSVCGAIWQEKHEDNRLCPICGNQSIRWNLARISPKDPVRFVPDE